MTGFDGKLGGVRSPRVLGLVLFVVSCREPARSDVPLALASTPVVDTPAPSALASPAPSSAASIAAPPGDIGIAWDGDSRAQTLDVIAKDDLILVEVHAAERQSVVARVRFHRDVVWQQPLPKDGGTDAAVLVDNPHGRAYVAQYSAIASGASVYGFDLATGKQRWVTPVRGLGPVDHSEYLNHVTLRLVRGALVVFGDEAQGRYIEVFDTESGSMRSTRILPAGSGAR